MSAKSTTDHHGVLGDKALIYKTAASGDVWQFRCWIAKEKKYLRKTLSTKDLSVAMKKAEELYFQLHYNITSGKKIFGITVGELVSHYIKFREEDVRGGSLTQSRFRVVKSSLKHLIEYVGKDKKIGEMDAESIFDYGQYRRNQKAKDATIRGEESIINNMMKYAYRKGHSHFDTFRFSKIKITEVGRRDTFTLEEYDELVRYMRSWTSKSKCPDEQQRLQRLMIRDCILIGSNTMLRVGELWQVTWGDVLDYETHKGIDGRETVLVKLRVRAQTSKIRKSRQITIRGGYYFKRLYQRTAFRDDNDYVFHGKDGRSLLGKSILYDAWADLMGGIGIDYKERNLTWYSLRHFGITCRLRAGVSIFDVAKIAGNSSVYIEQHYGHFDQDMSRAAALKNFTINKDGIDEVEDSGMDGE